MHVAEAGDGPLVVLLHGFPDFWYSWRRQIPALAAVVVERRWLVYRDGPVLS